jgi:DNA modification methylase
VTTPAEVLANIAPWGVDCGDAVKRLRAMPAACVDCCVTSPPYYGLRDYGTSRWVGGDPACDHKRSALMRAERNEDRRMLGDSLATNARQLIVAARAGCRCGAVREDDQIGLEETPAAYVDRIVGVFSEVRRVLKPTGALWLNLGDSYANDARGPKGKPGPGLQGAANVDPVQKPWRAAGLKKTDLIGIPWMVAFALREDGWFLRGEALWHKPNAMTESMLSRPGRSHETVFLLTTGPRYYFDRLAVPGTQLLRSVWTIPVNRYHGAHFATMPAALAARCVLTASSERGCCPECGRPWTREIVRERMPTRPGTDIKYLSKSDGDEQSAAAMGWNRPQVIGNRDPQRHVTKYVTEGWKPGCACDAGDPVPAVVLDPFAGSGTTLKVAVELGRRAVGVELNPEYLPLIAERMAGPPCLTPTKVRRPRVPKPAPDLFTGHRPV